MQPQRRSAIAFASVLATLIVAATALAQPDSETGGTPAGPPATVGDSGGVPGPERTAPKARPSQQPAQEEEPPQLEPPAEEPGADEQEAPATPEEATPPEDDESTAAPAAGTGAGSGGGGLPSTGLEIGALTAVGLGLLLAGLALRRRPSV